MSDQRGGGGCARKKAGSVYFPPGANVSRVSIVSESQIGAYFAPKAAIKVLPGASPALSLYILIYEEGEIPD